MKNYIISIICIVGIFWAIIEGVQYCNNINVNRCRDIGGTIIFHGGIAGCMYK